jgi:hypothetical protein
LSILLQGIEQRIEVHLFSAGVIGIDPRQHQNFADQGFEPVAFTGQARPEFFPFFRVARSANASAMRRRARGERSSWDTSRSNCR